ncbi:CpaD family pilus assembly protein [Qipengyuania vesicularis]|uniref:CpaD family pilus assembly protein n=1 Tax=Qipengyuania vesicularis TaxID=2867232 RepID=UPI001C88A8C0|nr:CpaD family pilus assembly protein [Qipengyuania vesicularis]MBX7527496.1 CpaD family pilus assembly protein [Qipengyuania vesicularis]
MRNLNTRTLAAPLMASLALTLGACGPTNMDNRSLYSVKQPVVERANYTLDVATTASGLPVSEQQRLAGWFETMDLRYGDRVSIDDGSNSLAVRDDVAAIAGRYGMLVAEGAPVTAGQTGPGEARVVITRTSASVPDCPDWSHTNETNLNNATNPNYGCSVYGNLAAMVANPEDLVQGQQGTGETIVTTSTKAIKVYREAEPTGTEGLPEVKTNKGGK